MIPLTGDALRSCGDEITQFSLWVRLVFFSARRESTEEKEGTPQH